MGTQKGRQVRRAHHTHGTEGSRAPAIRPRSRPGNRGRRLPRSRLPSLAAPREQPPPPPSLASAKSRFRWDPPPPRVPACCPRAAPAPAGGSSSARSRVDLSAPGRSRDSSTPAGRRAGARRGRGLGSRRPVLTNPLRRAAAAPTVTLPQDSPAPPPPRPPPPAPPPSLRQAAR